MAASSFATGGGFANRVMFIMQQEIENFQDRSLYKPDPMERKKLSYAASKTPTQMPSLPSTADQSYINLYERLQTIYNNGESVWCSDQDHRDYSALVRTAARNSGLSHEEKDVAAHCANMLSQFRNKASHSACQLFGLSVPELQQFIETSIVFLHLIKRDNCPAIAALEALKKELTIELSIWNEQNARFDVQEQHVHCETFNCQSCGAIMEAIDLEEGASPEPPKKRSRSSVADVVLCTGCGHLIITPAASTS